VVLTFDDGFADFALEVYPLLEKYGYPATVYLTTYYSTFNRPIFGLICSYLLWKSERDAIRSTDLALGLPQETWDLRDQSQRNRAHQAIVREAEANGLDASAKDDLARKLAQVVGLDYDDLVRRRILCLLTPREVTDLAAKGVDFQLHTHRHRTPVDRSLFFREIEDNRAELQEMTGRPGTHFCYPSGVYEPEFLGWLREAGVRSATTCDTGISNAGMDPLLLPRLIDTMNIAPIEFEGWLTGVSAFLPLRPHRPTHG
jgi:peptidoglycan/xylan/chitin deacetylase (PgdA/CDA1 family)